LSVVLDTGLRVGRQRILVHDLLLADFAPPWLHRTIGRVGRPTVHEIAWTNRLFPLGRVGAPEWIFHRIQVIEIAEVFIETMYAGQQGIPVAQVVLPELTGGVSHRLERRRSSRRASSSQEANRLVLLVSPMVD